MLPRLRLGLGAWRCHPPARLSRQWKKQKNVPKRPKTALFKPGQSHLNSGREHLKQVIFLPTGLQLLGMDTTFGSLFMFEQVKRNMAKNSQVYRSLILPDSTMIFIQSNIQNPIQLFFD